MAKNETAEAKTAADETAEVKTAADETAEVKAAADDGYVDHAPLFQDGEKYRFPLNVTVNGVKYSVPRGVPLRLPKVVAEVIDQSIAQDAYAHAVDRKAQRMQVVNF